MKINRKEICVVAYCQFCCRALELEVNEDDYDAWKDGELVQNAFPYLSSAEREILVSGMCPSCWDKMIGMPEEPDENDDEYIDDWHDDWDIEMGFDPYEGCYTFDC
jgi:hypothetical protein